MIYLIQPLSKSYINHISGVCNKIIFPSINLFDQFADTFDNQMKPKAKHLQRNKAVIHLIDEFVKQKNLNIMIYAWLKIKSSLFTNLNAENKKKISFKKQHQNADRGQQSRNSTNIIRELAYNQTPGTVNGFSLIQHNDSLQKQQSQFFHNLQSTDLFMRNQVFQEIVIDRLRGIEQAIKRMKRVNVYQPQQQQQQSILNPHTQYLHQASRFGRSLQQQYSYIENPTVNKNKNYVENYQDKRISAQILNETKSLKSFLGGSSRNISTKGWKPRFYKGNQTQSLSGHPRFSGSRMSRGNLTIRDHQQKLSLSRRFMEYQPSYVVKQMQRRQNLLQKEQAPLINSFNQTSFSKKKIGSMAALVPQKDDKLEKYLKRQKNSTASFKQISKK